MALLYSFLMPSIEDSKAALDFAKVFPFVSDEAQPNLQRATAQRRALAEALRSTSYATITQTSAAYARSISTLCAQLTIAPEEVRGRKKGGQWPVFTWTSAVDASPAQRGRIVPVQYATSLFNDECAQVFFVHGLSLYMQAAELDFAPEEAKADAEKTRLLRSAAGVFSTLASVIMPQLHEFSRGRAPDTQIPLLEALAMLCLANAQELGIRTALQAGKSKALVARLALGTAVKFAEAVLHLHKHKGKELSDLRPSLWTYMDTKVHLYKALGRYYMGVEAQDKASYGECVAWFDQAQRSLSTMPAIDTESERNRGMDAVKEHARRVRTTIADALRAAKRDNDEIYFAVVPKKEELSLPDAAFVLKAIDYSPPDIVDAPFVDVDPEKMKKCVVC